jgi:hypothetical protein
MRRATLRRLVLALAVADGLVLLFAFVVLFALPRPGIDVKKAKAHTASVSIAQACESYREAPANTKQEYPTTFEELLHPPRGGPAYLKNGERDLIDPWGNRFQMERKRTPDGRAYVLISTAAPDGMPVSNFGLGKKAFPSFE